MKAAGATDGQDEAGRLPKDGHAIEWRPHASQGGILAVCLALLLLSCSAAALGYAAGHPIGLDSFAGIVAGLAALLLGLSAGILAYGYYSMRYRLDDRVLSIAWLWTREAVPLGSIEGLYRGNALGKGQRWLG